MNDLKFIYFDIGGVLLDWSDYFKTVTTRFKIPRKKFLKIWSTGTIDDDITRGKITPDDMWKVAIDKFKLSDTDGFDFLESWIRDYKPIKETHELVYDLRKKYKIGLISNLYKGMMPRLIDLGIIPEIEYAAIILSYETGLKKPDRKIFDLATLKAGVSSEEIFFIDDRIDFIIGAGEAGWNTFLFDPNNPIRSITGIRQKLKQF